jgi:hypothetical protein
MYLLSDDVQVHQTQAVLSHGPLENGIGSENVNLPALSLCDLTQTQDDAASSAEARVADNVQQLQRIHLFIRGHA